MVIQRLVIVAVVLALLTVGCTSSNERFSEDRDEASIAPIASLPVVDLVESPGSFDQAKLAWEKADISDYEVIAIASELQRRQGCRWSIVVTAGVITESLNEMTGTSTTCGQWDLAVGELHDLIEQLTDEVGAFSDRGIGESTFEVVFNEVGVPVSIEYDIANVIDEEVSMKLTFRALPGDTVPISADSVFLPSGFAAAKTAWDNANIDNYRISATENRNYWSKDCTWHNIVTGGVVTESTVDPTSTGQYCSKRTLRVEELHQQIARAARAIDESNGRGSSDDMLEVVFNDVGVPESVEFDLADTADDESSLRVTFATVTAEEFELSSESDPVAPLAEARTTWANAGIANYRISTYENRNFWRNGCTWTAIVMDGTLAESTIDPTESPPVCDEWIYTVEVLHDRIEAMADRISQDHDLRRHTLEVSFDEFGVPESIEYDDRDTVDEESLMSVTFTVLP